MLTAAMLLVVHMIDGRTVVINPRQVLHFSEARRDVDEGKQMAPGVRCVVFFVDGSYVSTAEECVDLANRWMLERAERDRERRAQ